MRAGVDEEGLDGGRAKTGGVIGGIDRCELERTTAEADRAGRAEGTCAPQREDAADEGRAAGVGVISSEREGAGAELRERAAGTDQRPGVGDVLAVGVDAVGLIGSRGETVRVVGDVACRMLKRAAAEADRAGGTEGPRTPQGEHAAGDRRATAVGVVAGEGDGARTVFRQNARAGEDRRDGAGLHAVARAGEDAGRARDRAGQERDRADGVGGGAEGERAAVNRDGTGVGQDVVGTGGEYAAGDRRAAGVGVRAGEGERAGTGLPQRSAGTDERRGVRDVLAIGVDAVGLIGSR